jgi:hypothetical protein
VLLCQRSFTLDIIQPQLALPHHYGGGTANASAFHDSYLRIPRPPPPTYVRPSPQKSVSVLHPNCRIHLPGQTRCGFPCRGAAALRGGLPALCRSTPARGGSAGHSWRRRQLGSKGVGSSQRGATWWDQVIACIRRARTAYPLSALGRRSGILRFGRKARRRSGGRERRESDRQGKLMNVALDSGTITVATATIDLRVSLRRGNLWSESGCLRRCWRRRRNRGTGGS